MIKLGIVVAATVVLAVLVVRHTPGINGPWYWKWPWRELPFAPLYPALLVALCQNFAFVFDPFQRPPGMR